jgi:hypothetical protein
LLNNIDKPKSDSGSNVGLDAFYEYFKNQNETPDGDDEVDIDFDKIPPENINNIFNSPITEDEILCGVKNLKNSKASGYDNIVNEHIKHTIHMKFFFRLFSKCSSSFQLILFKTFRYFTFVFFTCTFHSIFIYLIFNMTVYSSTPVKILSFGFTICIIPWLIT